MFKKYIHGKLAVNMQQEAPIFGHDTSMYMACDRTRSIGTAIWGAVKHGFKAVLCDSRIEFIRSTPPLRVFSLQNLTSFHALKFPQRQHLRRCGRLMA